MTSRPPWGVFLDRDGTLVPDVGHAVRPEQIRFYRNAMRGLRVLRRAGATLVVVSNQSAVARGLLSKSGLGMMDRRLRSLAERAGAPLFAAYYCPHLPELTGSCDCRKPAPGLVLRGLCEAGLDARRSFLVGDTASDMLAGRAAGLRTVLVLTGGGRQARASVERSRTADAIVRDVESASRWILKQHIS